jgi:hypothetical protein
MSYPQPSSDTYVRNGYDYFRLRTMLSSPGDIYESLESGNALAIGPESDIANVNVNYFDDQATNQLQQTAVSPLRSFAGRIDAQIASTYAPSQRPGRILFWPADIYDPNFKPRAFTTGDVMNFQAPVLDVIQYFAPPPTLVPQRIDKSFVFQNYSTSNTAWIVIPFYGRKFAYVQFTNRTVAATPTFQIIGVNYAITPDTAPSMLVGTPYHQEKQILAPTSVAFGDSAEQIITATGTGMFDALVIGVDNATGPAPLRVITSDTL